MAIAGRALGLIGYGLRRKRAWVSVQPGCAGGDNPPELFRPRARYLEHRIGFAPITSRPSPPKRRGTTLFETGL